MTFSVLVPTFHRPSRLARLLHHLCLQVNQDLLDQIGFELIIADGYIDPTLDVLKNPEVIKYIDILKDFCCVKVLSKPNTSLSKRLFELVDSASGKYVMLLGDDDLIILENCRNLLNEYDQNKKENITIAGRMVNITGLSLFGLRMSTAERPYTGFTLDHPCPSIRIAQYFSYNSVGTTGLAYAIQSREIAKVYCGYAIQEEFYYAGLEILQQAISLISGPVIISETPLILRDFTYLDYDNYRESQREAPTSDNYPYFGEKSIKLIARLISETSNFSKSESFDLLKSIIKLGLDLGKARGQVRDAQIYSLPLDINPKHLHFANLVWRTHLKSIYSKRSIMYLRLSQIPGYLLLRKAKSWINQKISAKKISRLS
jgi:glycosyltransferase involved in cell wall biosynthesis